MKKIILLVFIAAISFGKAEAQVNVGDSLALVDFYNSTDGPSWSSWVLTNPVTTWIGVSVNNNRVTALYPPSGLVGKIPASLGNLSALTYLSLNAPRLKGKIPSSLGNLTNLGTLIIALCGFTGSIPSSFGKLINLTDFELVDDQLSGSIPSSLGNLLNLSTFNLRSNKLNGNIPAELGNLTKLTTFEIDNNQLSGNIPSSLSNLSLVTTFTLNSNNLSGSIPPSFGKLSKLETFYIYGNNLCGAIPDKFAHLPKLVDLRIEQNHFNFAGMEAIQKVYGSAATYSPQASILLNRKGKKLSLSAGGTLLYDTFRLYKNGVLTNTKVGDSIFTTTGTGSYYFTVTNKIATRLTLYTDTVVISGLEGTDENKTIAKTSILYPNPAKDVLNISLSASQNEKAQIQIVDANGKIVFNQSTNLFSGTSTQTINISKLAKGNYFVQIKTDEGSRSEKFVKE